ncbi:hypothetical protein AJ80_03878 [Polytolypa hystricis UAMH7299]|uniref:Uncharacterized protein n=1 Tax=Polytolypa hystricis (strain UAMH7299) TaxID=1447883 RepID=A0A2B7YF85_POLH7|nr:hypothetical protein AJ80_03878 [Polytolypa hystricis UAMH7299]
MSLDVEIHAAFAARKKKRKVEDMAAVENQEANEVEAQGHKKPYDNPLSADMIPELRPTGMGTEHNTSIPEEDMFNEVNQNDDGESDGSSVEQLQGETETETTTEYEESVPPPSRTMVLPERGIPWSQPYLGPIGWTSPSRSPPQPFLIYQDQDGDDHGERFVRWSRRRGHDSFRNWTDEDKENRPPRPGQASGEGMDVEDDDVDHIARLASQSRNFIHRRRALRCNHRDHRVDE